MKLNPTYVKMPIARGQYAWADKNFICSHQRLNEENLYKTNKIWFGQWIVGITDGDGTFSIVRQNNKWNLAFKITQSRYNLRLLYYIKKELGVGSVRVFNDLAFLVVSNIFHLKTIIVPIFDKYTLLTHKYFYYTQLKKAIFILENENLNLLEKNNELDLLSKPNLPVDYVSPAIINLNEFSNMEEILTVIRKRWLIGFSEVRTIFNMYELNSNIIIEFSINHKSDKLILQLIRRILHIPNSINKLNNNYFGITTKNSRALSNIVKYYNKEFKGIKSLQFKLWSKGIYYKNDYNKVFKINKILAKVRTQDMLSLNSGIRRHFHSQPFAMIDGNTSSEYNKNILSPWFVTGLSDGEASFIVTIYKDYTKKTGWRIQPTFSMELQGKDMLVLKNLQSFFGVGSIYERQKNKQGIYFVRTLEDLTNVIIPHFNKYHLLTKKYADFVLFKAIVELMNKKEHLTDEGVIKIISLRASMNKGLSEELLKNFSGTISVVRSSLEFSDNIDPCWLAGFTSAWGVFLCAGS
jgi:hypothetical protein